MSDTKGEQFDPMAALEFCYRLRGLFEEEKFDEARKILEEFISSRFSKEEIKRFEAEEAQRKKAKTILTVSGPV